MAIPETGLLARAEVEAWAARRGEPAWLTDMRLQAAEEAGRLPLPHVSKATVLTQLDWRSWRPPEELHAAALPSTFGGAERSGFAALSGGRVVRAELAEEAAAQGVLLLGLAEAAQAYPDLVRAYLGRAFAYEPSPLTAWQLALWDGGVFLYVPRGVALEHPVKVVHYAAGEDLAALPHVLVVAGEGSQVRVVESYLSEQGARLNVLSGVEAVVEEGAQLRYAVIQNLGARVRAVQVRRARVGRDGRLTWITGELGGRLSASDTATALSEPGASSQHLSVFFAAGRQQMDIATRMLHLAPHTEGLIEARGVVKDKAQALFWGLTDIERQASSSRGWQRERTLMLDPQARADAVPSLKIDTDNVVAGHAASAGQIDEEQVFYLMSRGLTRSAAVYILVSGFLRPLMEQIDLAEVRQEIDALIERKMR